MLPYALLLRTPGNIVFLSSAPVCLEDASGKRRLRLWKESGLAWRKLGSEVMAMGGPDTIHTLRVAFLIFAGVVILLTALKWVTFLRRIRSMGQNIDRSMDRSTDRNTEGNTDGNTDAILGRNLDGNMDASMDGNPDNNVNGNCDINIDRNAGKK